MKIQKTNKTENQVVTQPTTLIEAEAVVETPAPKKTPTKKKTADKVAEATAKAKAEEKVADKKAPTQKKVVGKKKTIEVEDIPLVDLFPDTLEVEAGVFEKVEIGGIEELRKYIEENPEESLICAVGWTPAQIKKYEYAKIYEVKAPKAFDKDLDIVAIAYVCSTVDRFIGISQYTEALTLFVDSELDTQDEIVVPNGKEFFRVQNCKSANGAPFEIYKAVMIKA